MQPSGTAFQEIMPQAHLVNCSTENSNFPNKPLPDCASSNNPRRDDNVLQTSSKWWSILDTIRNDEMSRNAKIKPQTSVGKLSIRISLAPPDSILPRGAKIECLDNRVQNGRNILRRSGTRSGTARRG